MKFMHLDKEKHQVIAPGLHFEPKRGMLFFAISIFLVTSVFLISKEKRKSVFFYKYIPTIDFLDNKTGSELEIKLINKREAKVIFDSEYEIVKYNYYKGKLILADALNDSFIVNINDNYSYSYGILEEPQGCEFRFGVSK